MFDLKKFNDDLMQKYDLDNSYSLNSLLLKIYMIDDYSFEMPEMNYDSLNKLYNSDSIEFNSISKKAVMTAGDNKNYTTKIYDLGQAAETISCIFFTTGIYYTINLCIIEFEEDGGIYFTEVREGEGNIKFFVSYYDNETASIFRDNSQCRDTYKNLKRLHITPDKYREETFSDTKWTPTIIQRVNALKKEISEKDKVIVLADK